MTASLNGSTAGAPTVVVFDLDGVIRDWNDDEIAVVEVAHGLEPGTILNVGFSDDLGVASVTGRLAYRQWMDEIRRRVIDQYGPGATGALDHWERNIGIVNTEMLELLRAVRRDRPVACLSNGTTRLRRDLLALDLLHEFDVVFNTAEIGIAKPDPEVFMHVVQELGVDARDAAFIDDLETNVHGARTAGLRAHQHRDRHGTAAFLRGLGLRI